MEKHVGGRGVLLGGIPGGRPGRVAIIGGGVVGTNAAQMAVGMGADVVLLDIDLRLLAHLDLVFQGRLKTIASTPHTLAEEAGAGALAGAIKMKGELKGKRVAVVVTGSNITLDRLKKALELYQGG